MSLNSFECVSHDAALWDQTKWPAILCKNVNRLVLRVIESRVAGSRADIILPPVISSRPRGKTSQRISQVFPFHLSRQSGAVGTMDPTEPRPRTLDTFSWLASTVAKEQEGQPMHRILPIERVVAPACWICSNPPLLFAIRRTRV